VSGYEKDKHYNWQESMILMRSACMGIGIISTKVRYTFEKKVNFQKLRVDQMNGLKDSKIPMEQKLFEDFFIRKDIAKMIFNQSKKNFDDYIDKSRLIVFDTFCELTDKKFKHRLTDYTFCAHNSDIKRSPIFDQEFEELGLIPVDEIYEGFDRFFSTNYKNLKNKSIYIFHYSDKYEKRELYIKRNREIQEIMMSFKNIGLDIKNCVPSSNKVKNIDSYPYHFSKETLLHLASKM